MSTKPVIEAGIVAGNIEKKYASKNIISKYLVSNFLSVINHFFRKTAPVSAHEVGCGEGHLSIFLAHKYPDIPLLSSDFSEQIIQIAHQNLQKEPRHLNITFKQQSIYNLNPEEDSAPLILCCEVLEHLEFPQDALAVLEQITQEYIILSVPREPLWRILNMLRGKYLPSFGNTPGHLQHWSKKSFIKLIQEYFYIIDIASPLPWTVLLCKKKLKKT